MSPQFVDFNGDGNIDIVAGTFDGSPHVAFGTGKGWKQPEQILDRDGARIVFNQFWNFDTKKWDSTHRCDPEGSKLNERDGLLTSAVAMDWDGDGDLDLLLGDHASGQVCLRRNEGTLQKPAFTAKNEVVLAAGKPIAVHGTVATLRLVDWNRDGLVDLACGSMGDAFNMDEGGGVCLYLNTGTKKATAFGEPNALVPASTQPAKEAPTRPDSGIYMDFGDTDGDGDLDLIVGGYSHWSPEMPKLTKEQMARVRELKDQIAELDKQSRALNQALQDATKGLDETAAEKKRAEVLETQQAARIALGRKHTALQDELDPLAGGAKRNSYVWIYENTSAAARPASSGN